MIQHVSLNSDESSVISKLSAVDEKLREGAVDTIENPTRGCSLPQNYIVNAHMPCVINQVASNLTYHQGKHPKWSQLGTEEKVLNDFERFAEVHQTHVDVFSIVHEPSDCFQNA